jgi:putative addiction module killer protein
VPKPSKDKNHHSWPDFGVSYFIQISMYFIQTTEVFDKWFSGLRDKRAAARIQARIDRAEDGNFGDCEPIGGGVSEMRIHVGPGYRVYFMRRGAKIIVLLAGGDKSTQHDDIRAARKLAQQI